jgi:hypothetical protein
MLADPYVKVATTTTGFLASSASSGPASEAPGAAGTRSRVECP